VLCRRAHRARRARPRLPRHLHWRGPRWW